MRKWRTSTATSSSAAFSSGSAANGDGGGWDRRFPAGGQNLSVRLSELTKTPVSMDDRPGRPTMLLHHPAAARAVPLPVHHDDGESAAVPLDDQEAANLRTYLLKGGFLWADDFWGEYAWDDLGEPDPQSAALERVSDRRPPIDHCFHEQVITDDHFPQIPSIGFWGARADRPRNSDATAPCRTRARFSTQGRPRHGAHQPQHRFR